MTTVGALLLAGRLVLAAVFILAGITKLLDSSGTRRALGDFGVPPRVIPLAVVALPALELVIAAMLLPTGLARYGALAALALALVFIAGMANSLARGRRPDCHCFGQVYSEPIGWQAIARNGLLASIALVVAVAGWEDAGPSLVAWLVPLTAFQRAVVIDGALAIALLAALCALLFAVVRQNGLLMRHIAAPPATPAALATEQPIAEVAPDGGLPVGSAAPSFALATLDGGAVSLEMLRAEGKPVVLLFSDPNCGPCNALLPEVGRWQREIADTATLALASRDTVEANRAKTSEHGIRNVLLQRDREIAQAYGVIGTQSAALVLPDGTIGRPLAQGADAIRALVAAIVRAPIVSLPLPVVPQPEPGEESHADRHEMVPTLPPLNVGAPAPNFTLPDLDGIPVSLRHYHGKQTLVLFWNPACGYCARMVDDLREWERQPLSRRAQLLIVAFGGAEDNRAAGLKSTVLLDPEFSVAPRYGVQGTPSAALVDAEGRLAAPVAVGAEAVLALAGWHAPAVADGEYIPTTQSPTDVLAAPVVELSAGTVPMREGCVRDEFLEDGTVILYNGCQQQTLTLNPTAALVWECCDGEHDVAAIVAEVREVFPDADDADADVYALIGSLMQAGMIARATA